MTLEGLREDIDRIDSRILSLLDERLEKGLLTRRYKDKTVDSGREAQVLERIAGHARTLAGREFTIDLYRRIMAESRAVQERGLCLVGFQGMHGAYGETAVRAWDPRAAAISFREFADVFGAVLAGEIDFGIVPVENTLGGIVGQVNSILVTTELCIVGAVSMPIEHCLLAVPGQDHRDIRKVYSHSQALSQCRRFLARNKLDAVEWFDTAGAAKMLAEDRPKDAAAIASRFAADFYGLEVIKEGIQDSPSNRTRFFALAKKTEPIEGNKCSVVFFADDKAGALFSVLEAFAEAKINLTRIESVPSEPGDYAIFIDFEGARTDPTVSMALERIKTLVRGFRILGCYEERKL